MGIKIVQSDAVNTIKSTKNRSFDKRRNLIRAVMVPIDYTDRPDVAGRPGYVWCRDKASMTSDSGGVFQAFNPSVKPLNNRPVWIEPSPRAPYRMTVVGYDYSTLADSVTFVNNTIASDLPRHGSSHTFIPGTPNSLYSTDVADITERNISSGRVYPTNPTSMLCYVSPVSYIYIDTVQRYSGGMTQDFTANIPANAGEAELDYVCIDGATNALAYVRSSTFAWGGYVDPLPPAAHVVIPEGYVLLSTIILYNGMTSIVERNFTYEIRPIFSAVGVDSTPGADSIDDTMIDWGTGAGQVSAVDIPIADVGTYFATDNVEAALQQLGASAGHDPVTLAADAGAILGLSTQEITLDSQSANTVFAGPTTGAATDPTFRALVAADVGTGVPDNTKFLRDDMSWQSVPGGHSAVTLGADAAVLLDLSGQEIDLDSQSANRVFAGPTTGAAADPTFRALVAADIPTLSYVPTAVTTAMMEPTGFVDSSLSTISFNSGTLTFNVSPTGANFAVYSAGTLYTKTSTDKVITNDLGLHYIYFDTSGVIQDSLLAWDIGSANIPIACVLWDGSAGILMDERHGVTMDCLTHEYLHETRGPAFAYGMAGTFAADGSTTGIDSGEWYDEDIEWKPGAQTTCRVYWLDGTNWKWTAAQNPYYHTVSSVPQYNKLTGGAWALEPMGVAKYGIAWVFMTNHSTTPVAVIMGQNEYNNQAAAEAVTASALTLATLPAAEMLLMYKVVFQRDGAVISRKSVADYRRLTGGPVANYTPTDHGSLSGLTDDDHPQYDIVLGADADVLLGVTPGGTGQTLSLDTQTANYVFAGPTTGAAADPTFRAVVAADLGTGVPDGTKFLRDDLSWQASSGANHELLSATHTDTDSGASPSEGDLVVYRTSEWVAEAPISIASDSADIESINFTEQGSKPSAPGAGHWSLYTKSDGLYIEDDGGTESKVGAIGADEIDDTMIDWGTGAGQVSAADVPIADTGNYFDTHDVEAALQALATTVGGGVGDVTYAGIQASQLINEIKGWMPYVGDNSDLVTLGLWWDTVGTPSTNATLVDVAGESITEDYEWCLKCVTDEADEGFMQRFTYADEPRVKSGRVLSGLFAVWSVSGITVTARFINSDAATTYSATTAASWTILKLEGHALTGTYCDLQFIAHTAGTFYVVPLGTNIGAKAFPLRPRGLRYVDKRTRSIINGVDPGGAAFTDVDLTSSSSNLTCVAKLGINYRNTSTAGRYLQIRRNGDADSVGNIVVVNHSTANVGTAGEAQIYLDDGQIFEYCTSGVAAETELVYIDLNGYWEWE